MLRTEKRRRISSVNIKDRQWGSGKMRKHSRQEGSILIGLIITMVVMAFLGAGMVYLTTTSTFHELMANNHARAYYAAESGGNYVNSMIRQALATGDPDDFYALYDPSSVNCINNKTYTMANGQFLINNWQAIPTGGSMHVTYDSIGTVGLGFLGAQVRLRYNINPSNQGSGGGGGGGGDPDPLPAIPRPASDFDIPKNELDIYYSPVDMNEVDIKDNPYVDNDRALNLKSDYYVMGLKWYDNPNLIQFDQIRTANSGLLSYRAQVKIKDNSKENNPKQEETIYNIIGISFRLDDTATNAMTTNTTYPDMYGISFVKLPGPPKPALSANLYKNAPSWYKNVIYPNTQWDLFADCTWYVVLWKRAGGEMGTHTPLAYKKLTSADWSCSEGDGSSCTEIKDWSTLYIDVEERFGSTGDEYGFTDSNVRYNVITAYLQGGSVINSLPPTPPGPYLRSTTASPQDIWWENDYPPEKFQSISWTMVSGSGAVKLENPSWSAWVSSQAYVIDDRVTNDSLAYICISDHTSTGVNEPGVGDEWETSWRLVMNGIADASLTTLNYNDYPTTTKPWAREIGLHIYNLRSNAQNVFYDNFYIDLSPSLPPGSEGFVDGTGEVVQAP